MKVPLVEVTTMIPTTMKEICWDQTVTSTSMPNQFTRMSNVFVIGSTWENEENALTFFGSILFTS